MEVDEGEAEEDEDDADVEDGATAPQPLDPPGEIAWSTFTDVFNKYLVKWLGKLHFVFCIFLHWLLRMETHDIVYDICYHNMKKKNVDIQKWLKH